MMDTSSAKRKELFFSESSTSENPDAVTVEIARNRMAVESGLAHPEGWFEQELAQDLAACWSPTGREEGVQEWMARPSLLRRIARLLAVAIPAGVDRIIAVGTGAQTLGASVSLTTGLPFVAIEEDIGSAGVVTIFGRVHQGESIAVVSALQTRSSFIETLGEEYGVTISQWLVVFAPREASELTRQDYGVLFHADADGQTLSASMTS